MPNIKQYTITDFYDNKVVFAVDHNKAGKELFHCINDFWDGNKNRFDDEDDDITIAVLKFIAEECFRLQAYHRYDLNGLIRQFGTDDNPNLGFEGYPSLNGRLGILLVAIEVDDTVIDDEVEITSLDSMPTSP